MDQRYPTLDIIPHSNSGFPKLPEDMRYNMSHPRRGVALIFNNKTFGPRTGMGKRPGTERDAAKLAGLFPTLGFETHLHNNFSKHQMIEEVKKGKDMRPLGGVSKTACELVNLGAFKMSFLNKLQCFRSWNCGCLVTCFCYQSIAKPGNKTAAVPWPDPYIKKWNVLIYWNMVFSYESRNKA